MLINYSCLISFEAIMFTPYSGMKFLSNRDIIYIIYVNENFSRECYTTGLRVTPYVPPRKVCRSKMVIPDLDP